MSKEIIILVVLFILFVLGLLIYHLSDSFPNLIDITTPTGLAIWIIVIGLVIYLIYLLIRR